MQVTKLSVLVLVLFGAFSLKAQACASRATESYIQSQTSSWESRTLGVDELITLPRAHAGPVRVEGVVGGLFDIRAGEGRQLTLIDLQEFASCGVSACARYTLTSAIPESTFKGARPTDGTRVVVLGELYPHGKAARLFVNQVLRDGKVILDRLPLAPSALLLRRNELELSDAQHKQLTSLELLLGEETRRLDSRLTSVDAEDTKARDTNEVERRRVESELLRIEMRELTEKASVQAAAILTADQRAKVATPVAFH